MHAREFIMLLIGAAMVLPILFLFLGVLSAFIP